MYNSIKFLLMAKKICIGIIGISGRMGKILSHLIRDDKSLHLIGGIRKKNSQKTNLKESILPMLQDIEFVTFAKVTQFARAIFKGAVALGGNGQFIRASTLKSISLSPFSYYFVSQLYLYKLALSI